jgi:hypothetical protein
VSEPAPVVHPALLDPDRLLAACEVSFTRRSGPGGQNRNKVETAAILRHGPTGLKAEANERRSQAENRRLALFRLRVNLALGVRSGSHDPPPPVWTNRLRGGRIVVNPEHDDFPALLAVALDALDFAGWGVPEAAGALGCTASQLLKLLREEPRAWQKLNAERAGRGLPPLH